MRVIALEYHDIVENDRWESSGFVDVGAGSYKLSAADFADHLDAVRRAAIPVRDHIVPAEDATGRFVVWTFDDGGCSYAERTADLLEGQGWRGTTLVTTAHVGQRGFLSKAQIRDLDARGHVVGTHTRNHLMSLSSEPRGRIEAEWRTSVADLEDILGHSVGCGSVPGGFFSREVAEVAAAAGLGVLFTSEPVTHMETIDGCQVIGRFTLRRGHPARYVARLVSSVPTARLIQWCRWNAKKVAKQVAGGPYRAIRERILGS